MYCFLAAWNTVQFKWVKPYSEAKQSKLLVWRETLLCVTRMALLLVVATLDDLRGPLFYVLLAISLLCLALVPFFEYRAKKLLDQGQSESAVSGSRLPINSKA
jgi:predicted tellurium resistance membrane protein TerC